MNLSLAWAFYTETQNRSQHLGWTWSHRPPKSNAIVSLWGGSFWLSRYTSLKGRQCQWYGGQGKLENGGFSESLLTNKITGKWVVFPRVIIVGGKYWVRRRGKKIKLCIHRLLQWREHWAGSQESWEPGPALAWAIHGTPALPLAICGTPALPLAIHGTTALPLAICGTPGRLLLHSDPFSFSF